MNAIDLAAVKQDLGRSAGELYYTGWSDLDGSGRINALDLAAVRQRLGTKVPSGEPAATAGATSASPLSLLASCPAKQLFGSTPILA